MKSKMLYSPKERIPLFRMIYSDDGEPSVEFKNSRTGKTETISVSAFVAWLTKKATVRPV